MHLPHHQKMLSTSTPETRDQIEALIRKENPGAFHVEHGSGETLSSRVFFDQPVRNEPHKGFVRFYVAAAA
jgi:hypothetical protein